MSILPFNESQKIKSFIELQEHILDCQNNNINFFIGRLSGNEPNLVGKILSGIKIPNNLINNMLYGAGIKFNNNEDIKKYVNLYNKSISKSTLLAVWDVMMYKQAEEYYNFINKMYPNIKQIVGHSLEPYYFMNNIEYKYNELFKNKKVLIISSHKNTIEDQLKKKCKFFKKDIFHETTEFKVYKPPQQNAGSHDKNSWLYHFNNMTQELDKIKNEQFNFDIALVSAGGFGMIISDYIFSKLNCSVIYIGGPLQLFFGINGGRWKNNEIINNAQNKYWTNVLEEDKPKNPLLCENSCYW